MRQRLPTLTAREIIRALERADFEVVRSRGSHRILQHRDTPSRRTVVADHRSRTTPHGTLRAIT